MTLPTAAILCFLGASLAHADGGYAGEIQAWRAEHEAGLRTDDGWLTVAGLYWLKPGENRFGTAASNSILFPAGTAPPVAGVFHLDDRRVSIEAAPGVAITVNGAPLTATLPILSDASGAPDVLSIGRLRFFIIERGDRQGVRLRDLDSPQRKTFAGLTWFPVDAAYRVTARFEPATAPVTIHVPTVLGTVVDMESPGRAVFTLAGKEVSLDAVREAPDAKELFFILRDGTSGHETYGGGRFLYSDLPADGKVVLDFNKAHSPPCALTAFATCPLPPRAQPPRGPDPRRRDPEPGQRPRALR